MSILTQAIGGALGAGQADQETLDLIAQIIANETQGKTGIPSVPGVGGGGGGLEFAALRPYLRLYLYQQENPWFFPVVGGTFLALTIYGALSILGLTE